jgi:hypothetical protein
MVPFVVVLCLSERWDLLDTLTSVGQEWRMERCPTRGASGWMTRAKECQLPPPTRCSQASAQLCGVSTPSVAHFSSGSCHGNCCDEHTVCIQLHATALLSRIRLFNTPILSRLRGLDMTRVSRTSPVAQFPFQFSSPTEPSPPLALSACRRHRPQSHCQDAQPGPVFTLFWSECECECECE